jgi:hypothetical protein
MQKRTLPAAHAVRSPIEVRVASMSATYTHPVRGARASSKLIPTVADSAQVRGRWFGESAGSVIMDGKSLEFGSLGAGRGAPFAVPLLLGILAVTAALLLLVDPPGLGKWLMFAVMAAICLPIAAFMLMGRHVLVDATAGRVVLTYSFGPLRWRCRRVLAEFRLVSTRFRPVSARAWLVRATPTAEVRETFRGVARRKKGDVAGGDADIAAAKAMKGDVADLYAQWGVSAP